MTVRRAARVVPVAIVLVIAILGPWLAPYEAERVVGPYGEGPSGAFWFGTDAAGMDILSRTIAATRNDLIIGVLVTVLASLAGAVAGLAIGMNESRRGPLGLAARGGARVLDLMEAVPVMITGLVVISFYGANLATMVTVLAIILAPIQARLTRTEVLRVRGEAYLDAARMAGLSEWRLTARHVLPNAVSPALENTSVVFGSAILITAALGFLGVGLPPPTPEWGSMISRGGSDAMVGRWWPAVFPTLALAATVGSVVYLSGLFHSRRTT